MVSPFLPSFLPSFPPLLSSWVIYHQSVGPKGDRDATFITQSNVRARDHAFRKGQRTQFSTMISSVIVAFRGDNGMTTQTSHCESEAEFIAFQSTD